jgi:hypothetical protein
MEVANGRSWPNSADGVQDSSLLIRKTHEFSPQPEVAPRQSFKFFTLETYDSLFMKLKH